MVKEKIYQVKYSKEELAELAKGVFKDDKESPAIYADEEGTFRNSLQFEAMTAEERENFPFKFESPYHKKVEEDEKPAGTIVVKGKEVTADEIEQLISELIDEGKDQAAIVEDQAKKIKLLQDELQERGEQIKNQRQAIAEKDKEIAELKKALKAKSNKPAA